jgi:hypothetical protein
MNVLNNHETQPRTEEGHFAERPALPDIPKTVEDLKNHPLYCQLTTKMQKFVSTFVTNGYNLLDAVKAAYNSKSDKSAEAHGRNMLRNWKVRSLVSFMGDYSLEGAVLTRREAIAIVSDRLRDKETPAQWFCKLYDILKELRGSFTTEDPLPEEEASDVNKLVRDLEARNKRQRDREK